MKNQRCDKFSSVLACRQQLSDTYRSARLQEITPYEWDVWSGQFNRTLRGLTAADKSLRPVNACLFSIWQSANRLLDLHLAKRLKLRKIRAEQRRLDKLKKLFEDLISSQADFANVSDSL